jgi:excisionase family DNA binding protein
VSKPARESSGSLASTADHLLALPEVAARLSVSSALVRRWGARGVLPRVKLGRLTRYRASDVARLVAEGVPGGQTRLAA